MTSPQALPLVRGRSSRGVFALALSAAIAACGTSTPAPSSTGGGARHVAGNGTPWTPHAPWTPEPERVRALADLGPPWITRSEIASLYEGKNAFVRNRASGTTGASNPTNSHPFVVRLGDRSGSRGPDADRDGISDAAERALGTDPANADSDGDTIPDGFEVFGTGTNPAAADSDGDGRADNDELALDDPATYADSDGDGLLDGQERALYGTDPHSGDSDGDGFGDDLEYYFGTAMNDRDHPDSDEDHDGEPDEFERADGTNPTSAGSHSTDTDHDGVPDWLDPDMVTTARVPGRRPAVAAQPTNCGTKNINV